VAAAELGGREGAILRAIVESYVSTAKPVSSGVVVCGGVVSLSSATVRNVMRTLEEGGLISQPHTSAGRVPTDIGYRYYVDHLMTPQSPAARERARIALRVGALAGRDLGTVASEVSRMMSELSRELAVTVAPASGGVIDRVELVALDGGGVLAVATAAGGVTRSRVVAAGRRVSAADVSTALEMLRAWLGGRPLGEAGRILSARREEPGARLSATVAALLADVEALFAPDDEVRVRYEGAKYMFRHPEFHDHVSAVGEVIDSEGALAEVVGTTEEPGKVTVRIGRENRRRGLEMMSLVVGAYRVGAGVGRVGVIGPTRMRYPRLVGLVRHFSEALDRMLAERGA